MELRFHFHGVTILNPWTEFPNSMDLEQIVSFHHFSADNQWVKGEGFIL